MTFPLDQILNILDKECQGGIFRQNFQNFQKNFQMEES